MGATDNAFIRVYTENEPVRSPVRRRRRLFAGTCEDDHGITIGGSMPASQLYAAAPSDRPIVQTIRLAVDEGQPIPGTSQATVLHTAARAPSPVARRGEANESTRDGGGTPRPSGTDRHDWAEAHWPGPPHQPVAAFAESAAGLEGHRPVTVSVTPSSTASAEPNPSEATSPAAETEEVAAQQVARVVQAVDQVVAALSDEALPDASSGPSETAANSSEAATDASLWQPQWEVERFRWPRVCDQLQTQADDSLSEIMRPLLGAARQGRRVIAVTSFGRGEGATTLALCLARKAAELQVPVALVDGDLDRPAISTSLGICFEHGWNDQAVETPLCEVAIGSLGDRFVVMPAGPHVPTADATAARSMLAHLSQNFQLVILDAGPIYTAARRWFGPTSSAYIHGALVVRDVRGTTNDQLQDVGQRLGQSGIQHIAIVENFQSEAA